MQNYQSYFEQAALIVRHLRGQLTEQEKVYLDKWLEEDPSHKALFETLTEAHFIGRELETFRVEDKETDWEKIVAATGHYRPARVSYIHNRWLRFAAVLVIFLGVAAGLYVFKNNWEKQQVNRVAEAEIVPGKNKAVLILQDGSRIVLDDAREGEIARQSGTVITKTCNGQLLYGQAGTTAKTGPEVQYNTLKTPRGGQYRLVLPDGSKVWLNAASSLKYPAKFQPGSRRVELNGEAYFEIARVSEGKNGKRIPFYVISGEHTVEVLGTHFNISSYSDEKAVTTTLLEGKVKVTNAGNLPNSGKMEVLLKPGEQSVMSLRETKQISVQTVDTGETVAWKNGQFQFRDADLPTIMRQISRWYDVEVEFQGKVPDTKFRGKISRDVPISQLFEILKTSGVDFKTEGRKIIIKS
ncbi:FecR family protein [Dyadobacter sp. SG02]|uniref:FecR family protein n=1 Tax=Dyadobacter sp. SG02 TaxID=1855291 RepID=UPI0008CD0712|nr:FecR family protein [Dyadobacter sp. SG02]SEI52423.1 FecR family protein [Dyadobacter sp. SG02]